MNIKADGQGVNVIEADRLPVRTTKQVTLSLILDVLSPFRKLLYSKTANFAFGKIGLISISFTPDVFHYNGFKTYCP